ILDLEPETRPVEPPDQPWHPDELPRAVDLLARGLASIITIPSKSVSFQRRALAQLSSQPGLAGRAALALAPIAANLGAAALPLVGSLVQPPRQSIDGEQLNETAAKVPRASFNMAITPHRRVALETLSLDEVKAVKNHYGVTVNDVVMAICAGALRRWLIDHDELPEEPLVAMVPVSVRTEAEKGALGNKVSTMFAPLATDVVDPIERLRTIHESMAAAKEQFAAMPAELLSEYSEFATPALAARAARALARAKLAERITLPCNVVISNIPGPNFPLYCAGAKMVAHYPVSTIADGVGLNITVMSYLGDLNFGLVACRELVPDLTQLAEHLSEALQELSKAAAGDGGPSRRGGVKPSGRSESPAKRAGAASANVAAKSAAKKSAPKKSTAKKGPARAKKSTAKKAPARAKSSPPVARPAARPRPTPGA
ncbi:MAG: WS/DGAT domain-containing protein, partial [Actinomycetota bacterium]|nr:WS/DGAT domain-containing protein [Actinomycetota bacterium]